MFLPSSYVVLKQRPGRRGERGWSGSTQLPEQRTMCCLSASTITAVPAAPFAPACCYFRLPSAAVASLCCAPLLWNFQRAHFLAFSRCHFLYQTKSISSRGRLQVEGECPRQPPPPACYFLPLWHCISSSDGALHESLQVSWCSSQWLEAKSIHRHSFQWASWQAVWVAHTDKDVHQILGCSITYSVSSESESPSL